MGICKQSNIFVNTLLVYLLVFVSGADRYNTPAQNKYLVIVFLTVLVAWYLFTDRRISGKFLLYMTTFMAILFMLSLYTGGSLSLESVISTTMKLMLAYLILSTVGQSFVETYIKLIVFLAAISLLGFTTDYFQLFDALVKKLPTFSSQGFLKGYEGLLYTFRHVFHPYRNNSIFFEPGAYQGFLNSTLFLILFAKTALTRKQKWSYIVILTTALITAASTTGFVIFAILYMVFLLRSELASFTQKAISVGVLIGAASLFAAQFHSAVLEKLTQYMNPSIDRAGFSAENRSFDALTDLQIFKEHVFGLGYDEYRKEFDRLSPGATRGLEGSSNGITALFANYGVIFGLFIFMSYYLAFKKLLNDHLLVAAGYLMFLLFLWGEGYYKLAPISFALIAAVFVYQRTLFKEEIDSETVSA